MKHPSIDRLALYAGGELSFPVRQLVHWHIRNCDTCRHEVALFREVAAEAAFECEDLPQGVHWERLAGEMRANIRLGLEAVEAISAYPALPEPTEVAKPYSWRLPALGAVAVALICVAYWFGAVRKSEQLAALRGPEPVLAEASAESVGLHRGIQRMELQGPEGSSGNGAIVTVSTGGAAAASYVDEETGQVTVNHVYMD